MAVVAPSPSKHEQRQMALGMVIVTVIGTIMAGIVGPIIVAILVGKIWG